MSANVFKLCVRSGWMMAGVWFLTAGAGWAAVAGGVVKGEAATANELLLVGFKPGLAAAEREQVHRAAGAERVHAYRSLPVEVVRPAKGVARDAAAAAYRARPGVRYVEPNYRLRAIRTPNEPDFSELWGLLNTGQTGGTVGADIGVTNVWETTTGDAGVLVAVIDTGIDYTHPELSANRWTNPLEVANGIDDDGNGIVDDIHGARWTNGDGTPTSGDPMDGNGHGTHVSGTIGAVGDNGDGVAGVNWTVSLMGLKFLDDSGSGSTADAISALDYAIEKGVRLSNNSWGGGGYSQALMDAIDAAGAAGQLFIAAAGNSGTDNDGSPHYPSSYECGNIVAVASSDHNDARSDFSCYGSASVDLAAPGSDILSTVPGGGYDVYSGTSMATPHVSGAAALLWSLAPAADWMALRAALVDGVSPLPAWSGRVASGGRLNVAEAARVLALPAGTDPVSAFVAVSEEGDDGVELSWRNPAGAGFERVVVRRGAEPGQYPRGPADGVPVYEGAGEAVRDAPLPVGSRAGYAAWAFYAGGARSAARALSVTVGGAPDYLTELFSASDNDLDGLTVTFVPDGSGSYYAGFAEPASAYPTDPAASSPLAGGDDGYQAVTLAGGVTVPFFGGNYGTLFVGYNGYITFGSGDSSLGESVDAHFRLPRVSALFDDLDPGAGGTLSWLQLADRVAVTYDQVPEYGVSNSNSFQIELFLDGAVRITWLGIAAADGLAGLSAGFGVPPDFAETDLSAYPPPDGMTVAPGSGFSASGYAGGPFSPQSAVYVISSASDAAFDFSVACSAEWAEALPPAGGTLLPGESLAVTVRVSAAASALPAGSYPGALSVTNLTSGRAVARSLALTIRNIPGQIDVRDSVAPDDDRAMPFGHVLAGLSRRETVTVRNIDPTYPLTVGAIRVGYEENFDDGLAQGWEPDVVGDWSAASGSYRASTAGDRQMCASYAGGEWGDLSVGVECWRDGSAYVSACVFLRASADFAADVGSAYVFQIATDGAFGVWKQVNGAFTWLASWTTSAAIKPGANRLVASAQGQQLAFLINDTLVWSGTDASLAQGRIGVSGYSSPSYPAVHFFDNVAQGLPVTLPSGLAAYAPALSRATLVTADPGRYVAPQPLPGAVPQQGVPGVGILSSGGFRLEGLPALPCVLQPAAEVTFDVLFAPSQTGRVDSLLTILSDDADEPSAEVALGGDGDPDYLTLAPLSGVAASGHPGGPFAPSAWSYTLGNTHFAPIEWAVTTPPWLTVLPASGTLPPVATVPPLSIALNAYSETLPEGVYGGMIVFSNRTTGLVQARGATLDVYTTPIVGLAPAALTVTNRQGQVQARSLTLSNAAAADGTLNANVSAYETGRQSAAAPAGAQVQRDLTVVPQGADVAKGELLVRFAPEVQGAAREAVLAAAGGGTIVRTYRLVPGLALVRLPATADLADAVKRYNATPGVLYAQPNHIQRALRTPNDARFPELWGMHNTGQTGGTPDADADAPEAWDRAVGNGSVVVAVIDTGVDYLHEDLAANMWANPGEVPGDGLDNDGNGYVDDVYGYDAANGDGDPLDDNDHGTHCAGTIAGVGDNGVGVAGVCWSARIMALKFLDAGGSGSTADAITCIEYAVLMGAKVLSNSWGGGGYEQALKDAIDAAGEAGVLFAAAAGNSGADNDATPNYPSNYESPNVVAVMSVDHNDARSSFSCYGAATVDLGAPGSDILSCKRGGGYVSFSGTSMATPHVAGAAALLLSANAGLTVAQLKASLMDNADPTLAGLCVSGGRLNLRAALDAVPNWLAVSPSEVMGLPPGGATLLTVTFDAADAAPGTYDGVVSVASNDRGTPVTNSAVRMVVLPDELRILPAAGFTSAGAPGGPFDPAGTVYALTNAGLASLDWSVTATAPWPELSIPGGTLAPGAGIDVGVSIGAAANELPGGTYSTLLVFSNLTSGVTQTRSVILQVIPPRADTFTERFDTGDNDLDYWMLTFIPSGSSDFYEAYCEPISAFPTDPAGGTTLTLGDDNYAVAMLSGAEVSLYGTAYDRFYIGSNGYITFGSGDNDLSGSLASHFGLPRISGLFEDLYPPGGGTVSWRQLSDRAVVTFDSVPHLGDGGSNSFQIEMFFDGTIRVAYLGVDYAYGLAGLSRGTGLPADFVESDLTGYGLLNPDDLQVTPANAFVSSGFEGGPFAPPSRVYTLANTGDGAFGWEVSATVPWLEAVPANGTLSPGATAEVTVSFGPAAAGLAPGNYSETLVFSNAVSGYGSSRAVTLEVLAVPGEVDVADSILPDDDLAMPFGPVIIGTLRTEQITIQNTSVTHPLLITGISLPVTSPASAFANGGFESGDFTGWGTATGPVEELQPWTVAMAGSGNYDGDPAEGLFFAQNGFDGEAGLYYDIFQDIAIPTGTPSAILRWAERIQWDMESYGATLPRTYQVTVQPAGGGAPLAVLHAATLAPGTTGDTGYQVHAVDLVAAVPGIAGQTVRINWHESIPESFTGPAQFDLDDVSLDLSASTFLLNGLPTLPAAIPAGGSVAFDVVYEPADVGAHESVVVIESNDTDEPVVEVALTGEGVSDILAVTPDVGLDASGYEGGPFDPASTVYMLANTGAGALNWAVSATVPWLDVLPAGGTLAPGATADVTVSLNALAESLPVGAHVGRVAFTNLTSGAVQTRGAVLTVNVLPSPPPVPFGPNPTNEAVSVAIYTTLSWNNPTGTTDSVRGRLGPTSDRPSSDAGLTVAENYVASAELSAVAIFEDELPWGNTWNQDILAANGVSYTVFASSQMGAVDLSVFDKVVVSSNQSASFYDALAANRAWFEAYVSAGGILDMHLASQGDASGLAYAGGIQVSPLSEYNDVTISDPSHPVVTVPNAITDGELDGWGASTHGTLLSVPVNAHQLIEIAGSGEPAAVEFALGAGRVFVTVQTLDYSGASYNYLENTILHDAGSGPSTYYDVYLDTVNPPVTQVSSGQMGTSFDPGRLDELTTYYWRVVASNAAGVVTGPVWQFTTADDNTYEEEFEILSLETSGSLVVDHNAITDDDRGGIAVSATHAFYTGDAATGRFLVGDLSGGQSVGQRLDAIVSDLRTGEIYSLANGTTPLVEGGTVTTLLRHDPATGVPTSTTIALDTPIMLPSYDVGIFAGYGRIVLHTGTRVYAILLPTGTVQDLGAMDTPNHQVTENWAYWGIAEFVGGTNRLVYVADSSTIARVAVPAGTVSTVATFTYLSDMACISASVSLNRWYFHHEGESQFGGSSETIGYADATFRVGTVDLPEAVDNDEVAWTTGGAGDWAGQRGVTHDGEDAAQSGAIGNNQESWMETAVSGAGTVSFWWSVSSEDGWDWLEFLVDGVVQDRITGETPWTRVVCPLGAGDHVLRWRYVKDRLDADPVGQDRGYVDEVVIATLSLAEALDCPGSTWTTGGQAVWCGQTGDSHDGSDAAQCGQVGDTQSSWMETVVSGPGEASFWWSVSSEDGWDWLEFLVDGVVQDRITGETPWTRVTVSLAAGSHTLQWRYAKDRVDIDPVGRDTGWVDAFVAPAADFLTLTVHGAAHGTSSPLGTVLVPRGGWTNVHYQADEWYRIESLATNGAPVNGAAGQREFTLDLADMQQDVDAVVMFHQPGSLGGGFEDVPTAWLSQWGDERTVLAGDADPFDLTTEHMLNTDPTTDNTYTLSIESVVLAGRTVTVTVRREVTGPHGSAINGTLSLLADTELSAEPGFTQVAGVPLTGECFVGDRATIVFDDVAPSRFYRAVIR